MNYLKEFSFYNFNKLAKEELILTEKLFNQYDKEFFGKRILGKWQCNKNILISDNSEVKMDMELPLKKSLYLVDYIYDITTYDESFNGVLRIIDTLNDGEIVSEENTTYDIECLNNSFYIINYSEKNNILKNFKNNESLALHNNDNEEIPGIINIHGLQSPVIYVPNIKNNSKIQIMYGYDKDKNIKSINFYIDLESKLRKKVLGKDE